MKSEDTKRIIKDIAKEEGISEWAVRMIVMSQFHAIRKIISSGDNKDMSTFKGIKVNAFCNFRIMPGMFKKYYASLERYEKIKGRKR